MLTINIHEAEMQLSRLVDVQPPTGNCRLGFMIGQIRVPDDFDRLAGIEIERLFGCAVIGGGEAD
jgi:hypothetical protein